MTIIQMIAALEAKMGKVALRDAIYQLRSPHGLIVMSQDKAIRMLYAQL